MRLRFVAASIAVHAALLAWLGAPEIRRSPDHNSYAPSPSPSPSPSPNPSPILLVDVIDDAGGGGARGQPTAAITKPRRSSASHAWSDLAIGIDPQSAVDAGDARTGQTSGKGVGAGTGNGIGFGNGGGVRVANDVPPPPKPARVVSKARPAKLIWPTRDVEVIDESYLFIARVTVDSEGCVVGARMTKTRPGVRGDHAANAIWQFRYLPALDDRGVPIRSTVEQPFQVR